MTTCTRCGQCCLSEKCDASVMVFGQSNTICPFLRFIEVDFYSCLLIEMEIFSQKEPLVQKALAIGTGCTNGAKDYIK